MGNRTAKFISALVGSIIAGAPLAAMSQNAPVATSTANEASDCLASPKGTAPQGQHWYYRLERATKRQCWYLRAEGGKAMQGTQATKSTQATTDTTSTEAASPSVQNAHAEYIAQQTGTAPNPPSAPAPATVSAPQVGQQSQGGDTNAQQPAVVARWPDSTTASPAPQPAPATAVAQPSVTPAKAPAPPTLAAAELPADKPTGSLQTLLLVVGGALALAGILASVVYRFAGGRVRVQPSDHRRVNWDHREPQDDDDSRAPWLNAVPATAPRTQQPGPVDFDAARPQVSQLAAFSDAIGRIAAQSPPTHVETAELDEANMFNEGFEVEITAPQLAANDVQDEEPADRDEGVRSEDAVDIDVITAMLERLAQEGPRLSQPTLEADLADLARSRRGQSAARA